MIKYDIWLWNYCVLLGSSPLASRMGNASTHNTYFMVTVLTLFFFFFFSLRAYSEPLPIVKCLKALVPYVMSVFLFVYSGRACLVPVLSQGQKWKPLYTDYRGRCIEEMIWMKKSGLINGAFWNESFCDFSGNWEVILSRNIHILLPGRMCRIEWWLFFSHMTLHYHLNLWYFAISVVRGGKGG